uniref:Lon N-terminal domain-containing protein n=1 Tax=Phaeocystis cordata TaxID=118079 RepID=A0A7S1HQL6_9EUKA|mmetsp:Transcript_2070/g.5259  ORF Transcript_2070/g.5259 Transcript_2070/m.5259 type:complete len:396 (-) Transcript_2070:197-1384(-)
MSGSHCQQMRVGVRRPQAACSLRATPRSAVVRASPSRSLLRQTSSSGSRKVARHALMEPESRKATGNNTGSSSSTDNVGKALARGDKGVLTLNRVPVLYTSSVLLPTEEDTFHVEDPHYVDMFESVGVSGVFAHCLHGVSAPEAMRINENAFDRVTMRGPGISVGCLAKVTKIEHLSGGMKVSFKCVRRCNLVKYHGVERSIFPLVDVAWQDDTDLEEVIVRESRTEAAAQYIQYVSEAEQTLWSCLVEIERLEKALGHTQCALPDSLLEVAPPEAKNKFPSRAVAEMKIWLGAVDKKRPPSVNANVARDRLQGKEGKKMTPYEEIGEKSYKFTRQELFSFAAAALVAERTEERIALLASNSTKAKLEWALSAAKPYMEQLRTEATMYSAFNNRS